MTKIFGFFFMSFLVVFAASMVGGCTALMYLFLVMSAGFQLITNTMSFGSLIGIVFVAGTLSAMAAFLVFGFFRTLEFAPMLVISFIPIAIVTFVATTLGAPSALAIILLIGLVIRAIRKEDALGA